MDPTVYLFDIDGTLLDGKGAGRRAMQAAFAELTGRDDGFANVGFAGMTDRAIVRAGLQAIGADDDDAAIESVLAAYLARLGPSIEATAGYRLHPGALAALDAVASRPAAAVGLGTGNVQTGAQAKLAPLGVYARFEFGGFGSDHEDRAQLLRIGAGRGAARLQRAPDAVRVVVIGDTPRDVAAAHAIGATCLAVATGHYDAQALIDAGAQRVVDRLDDAAAIAMLLNP